MVQGEITWDETQGIRIAVGKVINDIRYIQLRFKKQGTDERVDLLNRHNLREQMHQVGSIISAAFVRPGGDDNRQPWFYPFVELVLIVHFMSINSLHAHQSQFTGQ
jgi:hypothetical protein